MKFRWMGRGGFVLLGWILLSSPVWAWTGTHYSLDLRPNFESQTLTGQAQIELQKNDASKALLEILSPRLTLQRVAVDGTKVIPEKGDSGWRISLSEEQRVAPKLQLDVEYVAKASSGLVFGEDEDYVYTAFHTCRWMPCVGSDLSRASATFVLHLPEGMMSVAGGQKDPQAGDQEAGGHVWQQTQPYPLYTLGFAAGRFTEVVESLGDRQLRLLGVGQSEQDLRTKFRDSALMLTFFEGKAGMEMPHNTYTQVLVPGGVAQEVSSFSMIGARMLDPILENPREDWVIAHEMAHQWWGNWITCKTWNEFWLNEGLTVFMTAAWKQYRWGEDAYQRELRLARKAWKRAQDAGFDKPLRWPGHYPSLSIRRSIQYSKAAVFLATLRDELGERAFWNGLRLYTQRHAGQTVQSEDFQAAMEESAGKSLQNLFDAWVY